MWCVRRRQPSAATPRRIPTLARRASRLTFRPPREKRSSKGSSPRPMFSRTTFARRSDRPAHQSPSRCWPTSAAIHVQRRPWSLTSRSASEVEQDNSAPAAPHGATRLADLTPGNRSRIDVRILDNWSCPISCTSHCASFAGQSPISASTANSLVVRFPSVLWGLSSL